VLWEQETLTTHDFESQAVQNYKCERALWPICLYDFTFGQMYPQYFAFRTALQPQVIHDYFQVEGSSSSGNGTAFGEGAGKAAEEQHPQNDMHPYYIETEEFMRPG
jgi:hypothetical protein